jgi:hypothetical protein
VKKTMTDTTQTTTSAPTGQAGAAGAVPPASTGVASNATVAPATSVLGGAGIPADKKPEGEGQGQQGGENKTTPVQPEVAIEVKLPEGKTVDQAVLDAYMPVFKDAKLTSEQASLIATKYTEITEAAEKSQYESWEKQGSTWYSELKADKDFGGAKFTKTVADAQKAVLAHGGPELVAEMNKYGIGNLPALVRAWAKVGAAMAEDSSSVRVASGGQVELTEAQKNKLRYDKSQ